MLRDEDIRTDIGRRTGGRFVRVVHLPTGIGRFQAPLGGESVRAVEGRFLAEIERTLSRIAPARGPADDGEGDADRTEDAPDPLRSRDDFRLLMIDVAFPPEPFAAAR